MIRLDDVASRGRFEGRLCPKCHQENLLYFDWRYSCLYCGAVFTYEQLLKYPEFGGQTGKPPQAQSVPAPGKPAAPRNVPDVNKAKELFLSNNKPKAYRMLKVMGYSDQHINDLFESWDREINGPPSAKEKQNEKVTRRDVWFPQKTRPEGSSRLPFIRSVRMGRRNIVWTMVMIIAGLTASALIGSMWTFFSFLALAVYVVLPGPEEVITRGLNRLNDKYKRMLEKAKTKEDEDRIKSLMKIDMDNERTKTIITAREGLMKYGSASFKYLFKALFFAFFSLGFMTSAIPLLKPLGLLVAFMGYFMES